MNGQRLNVWCDGELMLQDISPSDEICDNSEDLRDNKTWSQYWSNDKTVIRFNSLDTASESYRPKPTPDPGWLDCLKQFNENLI